tara:strand:- start:516 stop:2498 length:1983 start_codon:yes stop_codon:yes gene_type:complete
MSSTAYGEKLLADVRTRNDKISKQRDKEAKKDQWKALGVKAAIGLAENVLTSKHESFINQEAAFARKSGLNDTVENAGVMLNHLEGIKDYAGGKKGYLMDNFLTQQVKDTMAQKYAPGTYSETQFNTMARSIADSYYDDFEKSFDAEADVTKTFFQNNDAEMYKSNRKKLAGATTLGGGMNSFIKNLPILSSFTGDMSKDSIRANQDAFRLAAIGSKDVAGSREKSLKGYQEALNKTKSTALADFVSRQITDSEGAQKSLGQPALVYTNDTIEREIFDPITGKVTGSETVIQQTGVSSVTGAVESFEEINANGSVTTRANTPPPTHLENIAAVISSDKTTEGSVFLSGRPPLELKMINDRRKELINKGGYASLKGDSLTTFNQNQDDVLAAQIVLGGIDARDEQISSRSVGNKIAFQLQLMDANLPIEQRMNTKVGKGNIFNTLKAYSDMRNHKGTTVQVPPESLKAVNDFFERNLDSAYAEFLEMNPGERAALIKSMNEDGYNDFVKVKKDKTTEVMFPLFKGFKIKMLESVDANSTTLLDYTVSPDTEVKPDTTVILNPEKDPNKVVASSSFDMSTLPVPPQRKQGTLLASAQKKQYSKIMRLDKTIKNDTETLGKFKSNLNITPAQSSMVETRLKRNTALLNKLYTSYTTKYAPAEL